MTAAATAGATLSHLDAATRALVRLAAVLASGDDAAVRNAMQTAHDLTPQPWIEELLLQTYLFAGFPRALNGMREWRRFATTASATPDVPASRHRTDGERTCASVYGEMYDRLRVNIRQLHPLLDDWMIEEGYGKVLSRPGLDLQRRELCIVAACAATGQDRQLQSHLHGARNVGIPGGVIASALESLRDVMPELLSERAERLWNRIRNDLH